MNLNYKFLEMTDSQLIEYAKEYSRHRSGEISELVYELAVRVGVYAGRVKILEKGVDDCK